MLCNITLHRSLLEIIQDYLSRVIIIVIIYICLISKIIFVVIYAVFYYNVKKY